MNFKIGSDTWKRRIRLTSEVQDLSVTVPWDISRGGEMPGKAAQKKCYLILSKEVFGGCTRGICPVCRRAGGEWICGTNRHGFAKWLPARSTGG